MASPRLEDQLFWQSTDNPDDWIPRGCGHIEGGRLQDALRLGRASPTLAQLIAISAPPLPPANAFADTLPLPDLSLGSHEAKPVRNADALKRRLARPR